MNRVIKFRVWDTELKQFRNDLYIGLGGLLYFSDGGRIGTVETSKYIIHQFTGLLDKNGKEIYEGDIVATHNGISKVLFYSACFIFKGRGFSMVMRDHITDGETTLHFAEVIGNIYENPELI